MTNDITGKNGFFKRTAFPSRAALIRNGRVLPRSGAEHLVEGTQDGKPLDPIFTRADQASIALDQRKRRME